MELTIKVEVGGVNWRERKRHQGQQKRKGFTRLTTITWSSIPLQELTLFWSFQLIVFL